MSLCIGKALAWETAGANRDAGHKNTRKKEIDMQIWGGESQLVLQNIKFKIITIVHLRTALNVKLQINFSSETTQGEV